MYPFQVFSRVLKLNFFALFEKKIIPYFVSLYTLVFESIKIFWELIVYFTMKIKNSDHMRDPLYTFQVF